MKTINFKKAIEVFGFSLVKYSKGYNYRSAFAIRNTDGKLFYFHIEDLRDKHPSLYYRTAENLNDYHGGMNTWDMEDKLEEMGYKVVEPRKACDYNSL